uniref:LSM4 homolog, U6 small nuclear RNA and mRNA degradation associated n=8 Tax=Neoaves TaxID=3078114 RepID=A0A674GXE6_TAEGU
MLKIPQSDPKAAGFARGLTCGSPTGLGTISKSLKVTQKQQVLFVPSRVAPQQDGDKFWRMPECYIRGSTIKYLRIPDEIIDMVKEEVVSKGRGRGGMQQQKQQKGRGVGGAGRGVFGGRGRGIPGSGRGQQEKKPGRQSAKQ